MSLVVPGVFIPVLTTAAFLGVLGLLGLPYIVEELDDPVGIKQFDPLFQPLPEYDYIVVGSGSSGSVIAARLSEDPRKTVLLLEAGGDGTSLSDVPGLVGGLLNSGVDWKYKTVPDGKSCLGLKGQSCTWHRGKSLGGSSAINGMVLMRGNKADYDWWADQGNPGWSFDEVLPFFKKLEDQRDYDYIQDTANHGQGGPITHQRMSFETPLVQAYIDTAADMGFRTNNDFNAKGDQFGFSRLQANIKRGGRVSTAKGYLVPALDRPNLHIMPLATAEKIGIRNGRATGVRFRRLGKLHFVRSRKEVILSAGAVGSPQLLMLSGIGPGHHLHELGIPVKVPLSGVGENLQSHVGTFSTTFTVEEPVSFNPLRLYPDLSTLYNYFVHGTGPLATPSGFEAVGYVKSRTPHSNESWPDLQMNLLSLHLGIDGGLAYRGAIGLTDRSFERYEPISYKEGFSILSYLLHPKSKGHIRLKSRNVNVHPDIHANHFSHPDDVAALIDGIKLGIEIGQSTHFKKFGAKFHGKANSYCRHLELYSDAYWECEMRHLTVTVYHDTGTCKMGPEYDPEAVVDARLRVYGVQGLRVADASVIPGHISGNTNLACIMVGEKTAHIIKEDHRHL